MANGKDLDCCHLLSHDRDCNMGVLHLKQLSLERSEVGCGCTKSLSSTPVPHMTCRYLYNHTHVYYQILPIHTTGNMQRVDIKCCNCTCFTTCSIIPMYLTKSYQSILQGNMQQIDITCYNYTCFKRWSCLLLTCSGRCS